MKTNADEKVLVGLGTGDDAGVYLLNGDTALVQTVDFITPVVDDPYTFGAIAAANSLSDVYAMGGRPLTAMNVLLFPACDIAPDDVKAILAGGADKIAEAGAALIGGHTVDNPELVYGLSVTGLVNPGCIITNAGAKEGDLLILTKAIGAGMVSTAVKAGLAEPAHAQEMAGQMTELNRKAGEIMLKHGVRAATDITGFGLAGHALGIARESGVDLEFDWEKIPKLKGALPALNMGLVAAGAYANLERYRPFLITNLPGAENILLIACDPQTSGGLLIACPEKTALGLTTELTGSGVKNALVGVVREGEGRVRLV